MSVQVVSVSYAFYDVCFYFMMQIYGSFRVSMGLFYTNMDKIIHFCTFSPILYAIRFILLQQQTTILFMRHLITFLLFCASIFPSVAQSSLTYGFDHPQDTARTKVWWFHGETVGTHEGITADLEAFKQQGVGGVVYYDQVHGNGEGAFKLFSHEWWDELLFSSQEARRLGLSFEVNCGNGYVAGGKWITPDKSMQSLACTEMIVEGGRDLIFQMPLPEKMPGGWHHDVAVVALPYHEDLSGQASMPELAINFEKPFTARSITYEVSARGKARTSSMQVSPSHFKLDARPNEFFGCGFTPLSSVAELQASEDGVSFIRCATFVPDTATSAASNSRRLPSQR